MTDYNPEKVKALETAVAQIERQFGKGSIMRLGAVLWRRSRHPAIATTAIMAKR